MPRWMSAGLRKEYHDWLRWPGDCHECGHSLTWDERKQEVLEEWDNRRERAAWLAAHKEEYPQGCQSAWCSTCEGPGKAFTAILKDKYLPAIREQLDQGATILMNLDAESTGRKWLMPNA